MKYRTVALTAVATVTVVAALTGCRGSGGTEGTAHAGHATSSAPPKIVGAHGLYSVVSSADESGTGNQITVFDPRTGKPTMSVPLDYGGTLTDARDVAVNKDGTMIAVAGDDGMYAEKLTSHSGYQVVGHWKPTKSISSTTGTFVTPSFTDDGRLRFAEQTGGGAGDTPRTTAVYSVDPARSASTPRKEQNTTGRWDSIGAPATSSTMRVSDPATVKDSGTTSTISAKVVKSDSRLVSADIDATSDHGYDPMYRCDERVDDTTLLCVDKSLEADEFQPWTGAIATLQLSGGRLSLHQVVGTVADSIDGAWSSPDGKQLLVQTDGGWFLGPMDGSADPKPVFDQLTSGDADTTSTDPTLLGWR